MFNAVLRPNTEPIVTASKKAELSQDASADR